MMKDLKLTLFSAAISASAGIVPNATFGFAAVAPLIAALWRALADAISETLPMPGTIDHSIREPWAEVNGSELHDHW